MDAKTLLRRWGEGRAAFRQLAGAIPPGREGFRPTPEVMSLLELVLHVASSDKMAVEGLTVGSDRWVPDSLKADAYPTIEQALAALDRQTEITRGYLEGLTDADMNRTVKTPWFETTIENLFYEWIIHEAHHRGNIITTLRVAGVKPPSVYG